MIHALCYTYIYNVFRTMCDNDLGVKIKDFSKKMTSKMIRIFKHANKLANISISKITTIHANSDDKSKSFERTTCSNEFVFYLNNTCVA